MNKILKFLKRRVLCINGRTDREMLNLSQFSPRVTRSKSKKQEKVDEEYQQKKDDDLQKTRSAGKPKERKKNKRKAGEMNSLRASRGSVGTISLIQTPKHLDDFTTLTVGISSPRNLQPPNQISLKSPPIGTLSADTPVRSARFHKNILNVAESKLRILGKGSFGTIIQATYKGAFFPFLHQPLVDEDEVLKFFDEMKNCVAGELVAAKIVPPHKIDSLKNELNNFLLSHPNIIKTLRIISSEENHSCGLVIMEMYSSFTLEHLSNEDSYSLDVKSVVRFMTDIANALEYCHKQRVLHLDVKPENILVNVTTNVCKLCDFGSSCLFSGTESSLNSPDYKALQSTVVYTSPELLTGGSPTDKSDVYSFGITLWQLIHKEKPYVVDNKIDLQSTIYKIVKQKKRPQMKVKTNTALERLYTICWDDEPDKRPTMTEVIESLENIHIT